MSQLALPLDWRQWNEPLSFIVGEANRLAVRYLDRPAIWPVRTALLVGPRKSGKSLLGRAFAARTDARLIDNADNVPEEELFHAWNQAQETGKFQLWIANEAPPHWQVSLPDLASRLAATPTVTIQYPDEQLLIDIIAAQLERHGLIVEPETRAYLSSRLERDYVAADRFVDRALILAAGKQGAFTIPQARAALQMATPSVIDPS
ncbi:DnaA ATPase domain-containing protein [Aquisediminimonas sediminicola]|uniref:DnaA ATPase domain-containing protein n=1 Tax=Alteraquisediminimonas sediminicola TaxID=2676787 RepID=UPI001C8E2C06|nr:DnaA/Hda family protein [Aquisediminimonas sediminicola]